MYAFVTAEGGLNMQEIEANVPLAEIYKGVAFAA